MLTILAASLSCSQRSDRQGEGAPALSPGTLPPAHTLLQRAAQAMGQVNSARFSLQVDEGNLSGTDIQIRRVQGLVNRAGEMEAAATLGLPTGEVERQYRIKGGKAYMKAPGSDWSAFDPTKLFEVFRLFDPSSGVARQLETAEPRSTEGSELVDGRAAYRVGAKVSTGVFQGLAASEQKTVNATLWIAKDDYRLLRARIHLPTAGAAGDTREAVVTITLSEFDTPMNVEAPMP